MQLIHGTEAENRIDGIDEEVKLPVLTSGQIKNPTEENMSVLRCIGIKIDDKNNPALDNVPDQQDQQQRNR